MKGSAFEQAAATKVDKTLRQDTISVHSTEEDTHGHHGGHGAGGKNLLLLAFSALGIIYGDIATSPLYAYQAVFTAPPPRAEVLSAASLFFWTLTLIVLVKYVGVIIRFDDNGEGGTFALYSLMCRAAGFTPFGPAQPEELQLAGLSGGVLGRLPIWVKRGHWWSLTNTHSEPLRRAYMRSRTLQVALLFVVMTATAMVVGDGLLTPSISVLSAVSGLKVAIPSLKQGEVVGVAIVVLVLLFSVQYMGTNKISAVFAPIVAIWLLFNAGIGFANLSMNGWDIWQALSPHHCIAAFTGPGGFDAGWRLLAGVMLAITGAEAMYADMGHFSRQAVELSFCCLVYPCLVITYMGQASFLIGHPDAYTDPFWNSVPGGAFWPMLIVATATSVVASQALISGVFSIMRQAMNLGVFPPMKVTHTDTATEGQIYISAINYMLMIGCIAMVAGFQDTTALGHAYGVAVMSVMWITSILAGIVMLVCYSINPLIVAVFLIIFVPLEGLFLSSNIIKIPEGGWVTIMIAAIVACINGVWWYGSAAKGKWYKAQSERNKGLLAQLPISETEGFDGASDPQQPLMAAQPATAGGAVDSHQQQHRRSSGSVTATWTATGPTGSITEGLTQRRLPGVAQHNGNGSVLGSLSSPAYSATTQSAPGGDGGHGDEGQRGSLAPAGASAAVHGRLVSKSWAPGARAGSGGGGTVTFNSNPLARLPGLGIIYTQATSGLPAVLQHLLVNMPALHEVTVLLTIRVIPRPYTSVEERFLVRRSSQLPGMYRVIARYGYMEQVDHGPDFVRQLIGCLMRFVTQHPDQQHQGYQLANRKGLGAGGSAAAAVVAGGGGGGAALGRTSHQAVTIELQPVDEASSTVPAGAAAADKSLARWSRVPVSPSDCEIVEEMASAGPNLASRSFMLSPPASQELLRTCSSPGLQGAAATSSSEPSSGALLGRESLNRRQYSLQKVSSRKHKPGRNVFSPPQAVPDASTAALGSPRQSLNGDGGLILAGLPAVGEQDNQATVGENAAGQAAGVTAAAAGAGGGVPATAASAAAAPSDVSPAQWQEANALLKCYRQRAVYIMGKSQLVAALPHQKNADGSATTAGGRKGCTALGAAARLACKGVATGAYRVLANNTHPSSQSWQLPDDQLVLVAMVVRM